MTPEETSHIEWLAEEYAMKRLKECLAYNPATSAARGLSRFDYYDIEEAFLAGAEEMMKILKQTDNERTESKQG